MEFTPVKKARWTTAEETTLIQAVNERESKLFGSMSGCGAIKLRKIKEAAWDEIADILNRYMDTCCKHQGGRLFGNMHNRYENLEFTIEYTFSQFFSEKRDSKTVKKKYYNLKGKAKAKRDSQNKTGGGPAETFSQAEALLLDNIGDRASVCGVPGFIDTDAPFVASLQDSPNKILHEPQPEIEIQSSQNTEYSRQFNDQQTTGTQEHPTNPTKNRKGKKRTYQQLAEETLELDKERMNLEIQLLKEKLNYRKNQNSILKKNEIKLDLEIETLQQKKKKNYIH